MPPRNRGIQKRSILLSPDAVFRFDQQMHHLTGSATSLRLGNGRVEYRAVGSDELVGRFDPSRPLGRDWNLIRLQEIAPGAFIFASNCWAQSSEGRARALRSRPIRLTKTARTPRSTRPTSSYLIV